MGLIKNLSDVSAAAGMEDWNGCIRVDNTDNLFMMGTQSVLADGGRFLVEDGQAALVIKDGVISDLTAETGGYKFKEQMPSSVFGGKFGDSIRDSFDNCSKTPVNTPERRVYYININKQSPLSGLKFGFGELPFTDPELQKEIFLRCYGVYDCAVSDPILFFNKFSENGVSEITSTLNEALGKAVRTAVSELSDKKTPRSRLDEETDRFSERVAELINNEIKPFGAELTTLVAESLDPDYDSVCAICGVPSEEEEFDKEWERVLREEEAAKSAAAAASDAQKALPQPEAQPLPAPTAVPAQAAAAAADSWTCSCGMVNTMGFCPQCGSKKTDKPKCANCGFEIPDELANMRFCPSCGKERSI